MTIMTCATPAVDSGHPQNLPEHASPAVEVVADADDWRAVPDAEAIVMRAIAAAASELASDRTGGEVAVLLTDDDHIRVLNRDFRGFDKPTNVLSFPAAAQPAAGDATPMLGDIAIAYETTRDEAARDGKPFADHLGHLAVHGFLHLIGYDHENDADAETMEALERRILSRLGIPDPYALRDGEH